ncbi:putative RNA-directed DNA polymerase [Hyphomicrobiales bacterium]|nr:hypothetical protein [Chelatococcus sp. HY11]CAH1664219.1 putative RNA-directed DNA polymerase [Hyphomicrobiales bacterium]CAH1688155.1 putative RNA-directed DNA polymerase [Hyphomicrobiales bacterium]
MHSARQTITGTLQKAPPAFRHRLRATPFPNPGTQDSSCLSRFLTLNVARQLAEAARIVLASSGARTPGIDGIDKRRMQAGLDRHLADLRTSLLKGTYRPKPVKRIYIPKANGKLRPLGIPTLTDRIVQRAMLMAMEPIWESDFHRLSYGFRPERSVHHAVRTVKLQLQDGTDTTRGRWIIEGDLASYFDTVHHRLLLQCVRRRVRDGRFVDLLWRILKAGHVDRGLFAASSEGVPQGGVLSPGRALKPSPHFEA